MPAFIKTPADEKKWQAIKHSVAKQRGKDVDSFTDRDWATVNAAWHKSEYEAIKKSLSLSGADLKIKGMKTGMPSATKMPKAKSMPKATDKPSKFFKSESEEFPEVKHPTLAKLKELVGRKRSKNKD